MKVNRVSSKAFDEMINGAGILLKNFDPENPSIEDEDIIFATSGGISATATPSYKDYGEDLDNCPKNSKELTQLDTWECKMSGTAATVTVDGMKIMAGPADVVNGAVVLRNLIESADFSTIYWVGEKTKANTISYVKLSNALSSGGIAVQTTEKEKGKFAFEFTGHYTLAEQDVVPFEYGEILLNEVG